MDSGQHGAEGKNLFALCSLSYAKSRFLLSDKDMTSVFSIEVTDKEALKKSGLISPSKLTVVSVESARKCAIAKWQSEEQLAKEKIYRYFCNFCPK
jgi:hypothetical protein